MQTRIRLDCYLLPACAVTRDLCECEMHLCLLSNKQVPGWGEGSGCSLGAGGLGREVFVLQPSCRVQAGQELLVLSPPALQAELWLSPVLLGWELAVFT